jgi:hypothetical protein
VLYLYLTQTGAEVVFPDGQTLVEVEDDPVVRVLDVRKRVLAVFHKADVSLFSSKPLKRDTILD